MNDMFSNKEELYQRVKYCLFIREIDFKKKGITVSSNDIWNCLIENKWINSHNLYLCDIVDDIMNINENDIISYLENKKNTF